MNTLSGSLYYLCHNCNQRLWPATSALSSGRGTATALNAGRDRNDPEFGVLYLTQPQAPSDRARRNTGGSRNCRHAAIPASTRLARGKQPPRLLIQMRRQRRKTCPDHVKIIHPEGYAVTSAPKIRTG
jgi:hypothetical protein